MLHRRVRLAGLHVVQHEVALRKRAALRVLPGETDGIAFQNDGAKRQRFRESIIYGSLSMTHLGTLFQQLQDFRMNVKALRHAHKSIGDSRQLFLCQPSIDFVLWFVRAMRIRRPVFRQLAEVRDFFQRARLGLFFLVFFANCLRDLRRVDTGALGVNLPKRRMILDAFIEKRLRDGRIVDFAVAMAAVADDVHDHVAAKRGAILGGDFAHAHNGIRVFRVHVEDRHRLPLGNV